MDDEFKDLQRLLSLKRHESPPPEYFEDFLFDFHRRQRAELLRRPLWRLALDRFEGALPTFSFARTAYVGSCAMALGVAVFASGHILTSQPGTSRAGLSVASANVSLPKLKISTAPAFDLHLPRSVGLPEPNFDQVRPAAVSYVRSTHPRYVLDTQPVSYDQSSSF